MSRIPVGNNYIAIELPEFKFDRKVWKICLRGAMVVGYVEWDPYNHRYCFHPCMGAKFDSAELSDISLFLFDL